MSTFTIEDLMVLRDETQAGAEEAKRRYEENQASYNHLDEVIKLLRSRQPEVDVEKYDFTKANNLAERLDRIATKNNGVIRVTQAAEILIAAKQTRSKKKDIRSSIHRVLSELDHYDKTEAGVFQRRNGKAPVVQEDIFDDLF